MNKIKEPLKLRMQGEAVADLQDALEFLVKRAFAGIAPSAFGPLLAHNRPTREELKELLEKLISERKHTIYGETTQQLVLYIQAHNNLGDYRHGNIDEETALTINDFLDVPGDSSPTTMFEVDGKTVTKENERNLADHDPTKLLKAIRTKSAENPGAIDENNNTQHITQDVEISDNAMAQRHSVNGIVRDADGKPVPEISVRAFDREFSKEQLLGEAHTDAQGRYEIEYSVKQLAHPKKTTADLVIKVFDSIPEVLATSELHSNAEPRITIDLTLTIASAEPTEYDRLVDVIMPRLNGRALSELTAQDIEFLATVCDKDPQHVALLVESAKVAEGLFTDESERIPEAVFFAWFRLGLPTKYSALLLQNRAQLRQSLTRAVAEKIVPPLSDTELARLRVATSTMVDHGTVMPAALKRDSSDWQDIIVDVLHLKRVEKELGPSIDGEPLTVADLFGASASRTKDLAIATPDTSQGQLSEAKLRIIAELIAAEVGITDKLLDSIKENGFELWEVGTVQRGYALADLTQNHLPLVRSLQQFEPVSPNHPSGTLRYLVKLTEEEWREKVKETGVPSIIEGSNEEERQEKYAAALERSVESAFPTAVVAERIKQNRFSVDANLKPDLVAFFENNPEFTFGRNYVQVMLGEKSEAITTGIQDIPRLKESLLKMERVIKITDNYREHSALLAKGFDSSYKITRVGRRDFVTRIIKDTGISEESAQAIASRAEHTSAMATALMMRYRDSGINLPVLQSNKLDVSVLDSASREALRSIPDLRTLFGSLDTCACKACLSVYSPAAYLVDILQYLKDRGDETVRPLDVLLKRRPDLVEIELSCQNSNTQLPYVDLVMEILENAAGCPFPHPIDITSADLDEVTTALDSKIVNPKLRKGVTTISPSLSEEASVVEVLETGFKWTIKDQGRRLGLGKDIIIFKKPYELPSLIPSASVIEDMEQLNRNELPESVRISLGTLWVSFDEIPFPEGGSRSFKPTQISIARNQLDKLWTITYQFALAVVKEFDEVSFGAEGVSGISSRSGMDNILGGLLNNHVPVEIQQGYFEGASDIRLETIQDPANEEFIKWNLWIERSVEIEYFPLALTWSAPQTADSPENLKAQPEHLNKTAYIALQSAAYPWSLPFDIWMEESRTYLTHLGVPRSQLMETFYRERGFDKPRLPGEVMTAGNFWSATERFGLTKADMDIISSRKKGTGNEGDADSGPWNFWGFRQTNLSPTNSIPDPADSTARITSGNWIKVLTSRIDVLLQQSGLSYDELRELLDMRYVNTADSGKRVLSIQLGTIPIQSDGDKLGLTCDLSKAQLVKVNDAINDDEIEFVLERLHRFTRLWRKVGWPMRDLDQAIAPTGIRSSQLLLDEGLVGKLDQEHQFIKLHLQRNEFVFRLLANQQYRDYGLEGEPMLDSLYERLFLNKSLIDPTDPAFKVFQLNAARTGLEPQDPPALLRKHLNHVAAVCGLSIQDMNLLLDRLGEAEPPLTLPNLSRLYFAALAARTVRISIPELLALHSLRDPDSLFYDNPTVHQKTPGSLPQPLELGLEFTTTINGEITLMRYWKPVGETGIHIGKIWDTNGKLLASALFRHETESGWQEQYLVESLKIQANTTYVVSVNANTLHVFTEFTVEDKNQRGYLKPLNVVQGPPGSFPTISNDNPNYFRDIGFVPFNFGLSSIGRVVPITSTGFSYSEALYLLRHRTLPGMAEVESGEAAVVLNEIRNTLSRIADETTRVPNIFDGTSENIRRVLGQLNWHPQVISEIIEVLEEKRRYVVNLATLPAGVNLPLADVPYVWFDSGRLITEKMMTTSHKEKLKALSNDQVYAGAIEELFKAPDQFINRDLCSYEPRNTSIESPKWPAGQVFPPELTKRAYYDTQSKRLHFIGPMDDLAYALMAAFIKGLPDETELKSDISRLRNSYQTIPSGIEPLIGETEKTKLRDELIEPLLRFAFLLTKLVPYRRGIQSFTALQDQLATSSGLKATTTGKLLKWLRSSRAPNHAYAKDDFLDPDFAESSLSLPITPERFPHQFKSYIRIVKVASLASKLRLSDDALGWLFGATAIPNGWLNPNRLPARADDPPMNLMSLQRTANLFSLRDRIPGGEATLREIFAITADSTLSGTVLLERLSALTNWNLDDLKSLTGPSGFNYKSDADLKEAFRNEILMLLLLDCFAVIKRLGATAEQCLRWSKEEIGSNEAAEIKRLARSRHTDTSWQEITKPLRDVLREKQRQALVAHLVTSQQLRDSNDLYIRYLIDVEMSSCAMTSRIKQACASIQLFVQRCLLNLEPEVPPNVIDTQLWSWMKNYRVWEANRKVFLYPENWIEPELRNDKTPLFETMKSALLQSDISTQAGEESLRTFLNGLASISKLDIRCICNEPETNDVLLQGKTLHVLARTFSEPHQYLHRFRNNETGIWSPWRQLNQDLGNQVVLIAKKGKLFVFWFSFTEQPLPGTQSSSDTIWRIHLNWMSYINGDWQQRNTSSSVLDTDLSTKSIKRDDFMFFKAYGYPYDQKIIFIDCYAPYQLSNIGKDIVRDPVGYFSVNFDNMSIESDLFSANTIFGSRINRFRALFQQQAYRELAGQPDQQNDDALYIYYPVGNSVTSVRIVNILSRTPGRFSLAGVDPLETHSSLTRRQPFVYQDGGTIDGSIQGTIGSHKGTVDPGAVFFVFPVVIENTPLVSFTEHYHPSVNNFVAEIANGGIPKLMESRNQASDTLSRVFIDRYGPDIHLVDLNNLGSVVDFRASGSYSIYNWELFFHSVFLIALNLSRNQRFEEAHRWFHYIFDPTSDSDGSGPSRFWRFMPFHKAAQPKPINELLALLHADSLSPEDQKLRDELRTSIADWKSNPFDPHRIARLRTSAYQWAVVMKYLDNLIAWGDQLFRRDAIESINEATQLYLLAAEILGTRPRQVINDTHARTRTYSVIASSLDEFSNVVVQAESIVQGPNNSDSPVSSPATSMIAVFTPYFCIPRNDKLEVYWELIENRLSKVRHCMNIEGVVRQLPLYEPPIDPSLLVRARAAGVDIGAVLNDAALPFPVYRFDVLSRRATELCAEIRSSSSALLSAIEKQDAERLTLMRAEYESALLGLVEDVRKTQLTEAQSARDSLLASRRSAVIRFVHYERMLGVADPREPKEAENIQLLKPPPRATVLEKDGTKLIDSEREEFERLSAANNLQVAAGVADVIASYMRLIPDSTTGFAGSGVTFGGSFLGSAASMYAGLFRAGATQASYEAGRAGRQASLILRENDWVFQRNQAALDIMQIDHQLIATNIRIDIAKKELHNHRTQIAHSKAVENFHRDKFSNNELYGWMLGQVSSIHFQAYQLAYDVARRAEKAYRYELGLEDNDSNFIQFGYWDSLKRGLLAGEKLALDIKRMEAAYLEKNRRELEITKHVSLRQLNPAALMILRHTGECEFELPEWLFDLDFSGHYFRRIKTVSLSIPCVVGPYTSVNGMLTLLSSKLRDSAMVKGGNYEAVENYRVSYLPVQSIATSMSQNDSGIFELNFRDERYLPFEGAGVVSSQWRLSLPTEFRAFDYDTISDIILHVRYTARDSGTLKQPATVALKNLITNTTRTPLQLIFDLRRDFPTEWAQAKGTGAESASITVRLDDGLYPLMFKGMTKKVADDLQLWLKSEDKWANKTEKLNGNTLALSIPNSVTEAVAILPYSIQVSNQIFTDALD